MKYLTRLQLILLCLILLQSCTMEEKPLIIGHRGAMGHETENTMASIQKALELKVDMIEIDVFRIKTGEVAVFHDQYVDRLANGGGNIEEYNFFDLRKLILDGNHRIPILQDVLKLIDNKVRLNIELKGANTADVVNHIVSYYVKERGWSLDNFLISSFKWEELRELRGLNQDIPIAILTEKNPLNAIDIAKELNAEAINPNFNKLDLAVTTKIKEAGFKVYTWTVNEPSDIELVKSYAVDGIITNYPERVQ
ncbi:MAG: glycerophosphodiester phosphodiesterase [Maribacter sp.]|nr:glycerophosphodiester phosphodiesterase [Maribacter sp.]